jgi:hypothetical protein
LYNESRNIKSFCKLRPECFLELKQLPVLQATFEFLKFSYKEYFGHFVNRVTAFFIIYLDKYKVLYAGMPCIKQNKSELEVSIQPNGIQTEGFKRIF